MSDTPSFGFGNFVPGFDFLKNLTQGPANAMPQMPGLSNWVAPTLSVEELDKRIQELKTVQFWLDQNSRALTATVQALEVQKMTLATLKGMNVSMNEVAKAFQFDASAAPAPKSEQKPKDPPPAAAAPAPAQSTPDEAAQPGASADAAAPPPTGVIDPMQWWGSLTNQFQQIAASAMQDAARQTSPDAVPAAEAFKTAADAAGKMAAQGVQTLQEAARAATAAASAGVAPGKAKAQGKAAPKAPAKSAAPKAAASRKTSAKTAAPRKPNTSRKPAA